jgi:hypothetical protein
LASAADLLKMKAKTLPAPEQAMQMARTLEAGLTEAANGGEDGALGSVVDRIFDRHQW